MHNMSSLCENKTHNIANKKELDSIKQFTPWFYPLLMLWLAVCCGLFSQKTESCMLIIASPS